MSKLLVAGMDRFIDLVLVVGLLRWDMVLQGYGMQSGLPAS